MQAIWTADEATYEGEFASFEPLWSWPKAGAEAAPADPAGGRIRAYHAPGDGFLLGLAAARRAAA